MPVVPTHVGVNRSARSDSEMTFRCPHACGGEPQFVERWRFNSIVVPTHVGVNRCRIPATICQQRCPHKRGGERLERGRHLTV